MTCAGIACSPGSLQWETDPLSSASFYTLDNSRSFHCFAYYQRSTWHGPCSHHEKAFWTYLTLQLNHGQPAIKHILIALGSSHESLEISYSASSDDDVPPLHTFSLKRYNHAVRLLRNDSSKLPIEAILVSCILFMCFEVLQGNSKSATNLIRTGLKVLIQYRASNGNRNTLIEEKIPHVYSRPVQQHSSFADTSSAEPKSSPHKLEPNSLAPGELTGASPSFASLDDARKGLHSIVEIGYDVLDPEIRNPCPLFLSGRQNRSIPCQGKSPCFEDSLSCRVHMITKANQHGGKEFETIISLSAQLFDPASNYLWYSEWHDRPEDHHNINLGIVPALFFRASHCRDLALRRKAVYLLSCQSWREGSWSSSAAAKVAEWVIDLEERGLADRGTSDEVLANQRIRMLRVECPAEQDGDGLGRGSSPYAQRQSHFDDAPPLVLLRYIRSPWDSTRPVEELWLDPTSREVVKSAGLSPSYELGNDGCLSDSLLHTSWNDEGACFSSRERSSRSIEILVYLYTILPHPSCSSSGIGS